MSITRSYAYDATPMVMMHSGACSSSAASENRYKFTGKERDNESGLDNFGARYDASALGRFAVPDPLVWQSWQGGSEEEQARFRDFISNPQNFDLYTYGLNNPLKYNDPSGLDVEIAVTFEGNFSDDEKSRILSAVKAYYENLKVGNVVVRDVGARNQDDKRTFGQKLKDYFVRNEQGITVSLTAWDPLGDNNRDLPNLVRAINMARTGDPDDSFGDLRKSDPTQWSNIIAWRILHETIAHDFGIGSPFDQFGGLKPYQLGTLVGGAYGRGHPGIPGLDPTDVKRLQDLLKPRTRSYGR